MRRAKTFGLISVVTLVAFGAGSATAHALEWLLDGRPINGKVTVSSSTQLLFADLEWVFGSMAFTCEGTDGGTVGPSDHDEITDITEDECEYQSGQTGDCEHEGPGTFSAVGLPWLSLLLSTQGTTRDRISAGRGKAFGWDVECMVAGEFFSDECTFSGADPEIVNLAAGVDIDFLAGTGGNCSRGGTTSGMLIGTDLIKNPKGHTLSVEISPAPCESKKTEWVFCLGGEEIIAKAVNGTAGAATIKSVAGGVELEITCNKGKYATTLEFGGAMTGPLTLEECTIPKPSGSCKVKGEEILLEPISGRLEGPLSGSPEAKLEGAGSRWKIQIEGCVAIEGSYLLTGTQKCTVDTNFRKEEAEHEFKCAGAGSSLKLEKEGSGKNETATLAVTVKGPLSGGGKWSMELN
jgi:hypothetical protein